MYACVYEPCWFDSWGERQGVCRMGNGSCVRVSNGRRMHLPHPHAATKPAHNADTSASA